MTSILHVVSGLGMGGAERNLVQVAEGLQRQNLSQHVVSVGGDNIWGDQLSARGIGVTNLGVTALFNAPSAVLRLSSLIRQMQPAIVQGWMYHGDLFAALAHRLTPGRKDRRLFWSLRASNTDEGGYRAIVQINARLSAWPDLIIANSKAGIEFHIAQGYRPRRVEVVPNGIDTEKFQADAEARVKIRADLGIPDDAVVAIHVARVDPMKDHATFLHAMASMPYLRGILVGAGTEALSSPANVRAVGLRRDVERYYAASDIVVSSSAFAEGFSNVIAEGMSAGLIPVATDIGDARVIVGELGCLVSPRSPESIATALRQVAELAAADRQSRAKLVRQRIVDNFSLARTINRYAGLYALA